jgi:hypothetical protein
LGCRTTVCWKVAPDHSIKLLAIWPARAGKCTESRFFWQLAEDVDPSESLDKRIPCPLQPPLTIGNRTASCRCHHYPWLSRARLYDKAPTGSSPTRCARQVGLLCDSEEGWTPSKKWKPGDTNCLLYVCSAKIRALIAVEDQRGQEALFLQLSRSNVDWKLPRHTHPATCGHRAAARDNLVDYFASSDVRVVSGLTPVPWAA